VKQKYTEKVGELEKKRQEAELKAEISWANYFARNTAAAA